MNRTKPLCWIALASLLLMALTVSAVARDVPELELDTTPAEAPNAPQAPAPERVQPEKTQVTDPPDDCQLQCHREFTACRQGAFGSGGPSFPAQAYEDCVDELEWCLMDRCGICV